MDEIKLENLTGRPLWVRLLSGRSIDLSPAVSPVAVPAREVEVNARIRKLLRSGVLRKVEKRRKSAAKERQAALKESVKEAKKSSEGESSIGKEKK